MPWYERHHDDEYFDEITIRTKPRWKTSGLSGDEWRTSASILVKRKGHIIHEGHCGTMKAAATLLPWLLMTMFEREDVTRLPDALDHSLCFQPGCDKPAVTVYKLKSDYCSDGKPHELHTETRVAFCQTHLCRGDCGFKDSDANYELVSGLGPDAADLRGAVVSESQQMTVEVDSIEAIPGALSDVMKKL